MVAQAAVEIEDVCFSYGADEVLHNVSMRVGERDLVAMVGPNGGGKSTLLKLILGLLKPGLGRIRVFGQAPDAARRRVGYVPQYLQFDPEFPVTVGDVVLMGRVDRRLAGPYRRTDREAAMHALEQVDMASMARRGFPDLSGGQRQRVLIAQALVTEPELLLLDEPTANVDAVVEHHLYDLLKQLNERRAIIVVSHNLNVVTRHASHVACINHAASLIAIDKMTPDCLHAVYGSEMTVLHHDHSCHVINPAEALDAPHRAGHTSDEGA